VHERHPAISSVTGRSAIGEIRPYFAGRLVASTTGPAELEDIVKRWLGMTMAGLLLGGTVLAADGHDKKKHKDRDAKPAVATNVVAVHVAWGAHDVDIIRTHYRPRYKKLPPGLRKKYARTGQLPPGWQKKMEPFPVVLERRCAPLPAGYRRGVIDAHAVIYNASGVVVDVAVLF
jgi:hypothetical protein